MTGFLIGSIVVAAGLALILTFYVQRRGRRHMVELQIGNEGNVASAYLLRAEAPGSQLAFRFRLDRGELPAVPTTAPVTVVPRQAAASAASSVHRATGMAGRVADVLLGLGAVLPGPLAAPLTSAASSIRQKQMAVQKVERMPGKLKKIRDAIPVKSVATASPPVSPVSAPHKPTEGSSAVPEPKDEAKAIWLQSPDGQPGWVETPRVQPLETLVVELCIAKLAGSGGGRQTFRVASRSESADAPALVEEGSIKFPGGLWAHPVLPYGLIIAAAGVLSFLVVWLA